MIKSCQYLIHQGCEAYMKIIYVTAVPETPNTKSCTNNYSNNVESHWLQQSQFILIFDVVDHLRSQVRGMIMYLLSATSATNPMKIECCRQ